MQPVAFDRILEYEQENALPGGPWIALPDESQLLWYKELSAQSAPPAR